MDLTPALSGAVVAGTGGATAAVPGLQERVSRTLLSRAGRSDRLVGDLAAADITLPLFVSGAVRAGAAGVGLGIVVGIVCMALGTSAVALGLCALIGLLLGYLLVRQELTRRAERARAALNALAVSLAELMSLALAGSLGLEGALELGLDTIESPAGDRVRSVTRTGMPWVAIEMLGRSTRAETLADLGGILQIGAEQRARTRDTLLGWSQTLRQSRLAEAEAKAGNVTEAMAAPLALILVGLLTYLGYPALLKILDGLGGGVHFP